MVLHSDQGSVYSSKKYNELLPMYNVIRSMPGRTRKRKNPANDTLTRCGQE